MANIISCDNCKVQSPNKNDKHIANSWIHVRVKWWGKSHWSNDFIYCENCLPCQDLNIYHDGIKILTRIKAKLQSLCGYTITKREQKENTANDNKEAKQFHEALMASRNEKSVALTAGVDSLIKRLEKKDVEINQLRKALEFYGNIRNYSIRELTTGHESDKSLGYFEIYTNVDADNGIIARAALEGDKSD